MAPFWVRPPGDHHGSALLTGGVLLQGVMSVSWCKHEASYLLSSGKDGKVILWDAPQGRALGAFSAGPPGVTAHQVRWSPASPGLFAIATMGGPDGHGKVLPLPLCHPCAGRLRSLLHILGSVRIHQFSVMLMLWCPRVKQNGTEVWYFAIHDLPGPPESFFVTDASALAGVSAHIGGFHRASRPGRGRRPCCRCAALIHVQSA